MGAEGHYFEVQVDRVRQGEDDGLVVGVTTTKPKDLRRLVPDLPFVASEVPSSWCIGFTGMAHSTVNQNDFVDVDWEPQYLRVGDRVGLLVTPKGELCVLENDRPAAWGPDVVPVN